MVKRHKPSNADRAATHAASAEDYAKLAKHVTSAIINKCRDLVLKVPYFIVFDEEFPKGILIKKDAQHNWYRAKTFKLADYLHAKGYMPEDAKGTMKSMRSVNNLMGEIDRMIANPQQEFLDDKNVVDKIYGGAYNSKPVGYEDKEKHD